MTSLPFFIAASAGLTLVTLLILCYPLLKKSVAEPMAERQQTTLNIFRDQLHELERDRDNGLLCAADFEQARSELQRRLLDVVDPVAATGQASDARKSPRTVIALCLILPIAAMMGYLWLGKPQALDQQAVAQPQEEQAAQEIDGMLKGLADRLKANPDDHKGWIMLARAYKVLGRFADAAEAFSHGGPVLENDPSLLSDYAEVRVRASRGKFDSKTDELLKQALKLNPDEAQALFLARVAAEERRDFAAAITHWQRLLPQLEPGSEEARSLKASIAELQTMVESSKKAK